MPSTVRLKPLMDVLYLQGATDKNISSDRPAGELLIQMGHLGSGRASHANLGSALNSEQESDKLPEQAVCREQGQGTGSSRQS